MGTDVHLVLVGDADLQAALDAARREIDRLERLWSRFIADSDVGRINRHAGRPVMVSRETVELISAALDAHHETDGAFDATLGSPLEALGYDQSFARMTPTAGSIETATIEHANSSTSANPAAIAVHHTASIVEIPPGMVLDLGGIGKGATADLMCMQLLAGELGSGISGALVSLGGDLRADGTPPDDLAWRVRLTLPGSGETRHLRLARGAVCTSSTAVRRWLGPSGDRRHHLIDPRTQRPSESGLISASIIGASAMTCDVAATVTVNRGRAKASAWLSSIKATGVLVDDQGTVIELDGSDRFLESRIDHQGRAA